MQSFRGARLRFAADAAVGRARELSQREGVTLFMTLLAALRRAAASLHRTDRHRRRLAVANRTRAELDG